LTIVEGLLQEYFDDAKIASLSRLLSPLRIGKGGVHGSAAKTEELYTLAVELRDRLRFRHVYY
jgi:hypothetical protein